jgi:hypothetical protein
MSFKPFRCRADAFLKRTRILVEIDEGAAAP